MNATQFDYFDVWPFNWEPKPITGRLIKLLLFVPCSILWMIGFVPVHLIVYSYCYIKYGEFPKSDTSDLNF